MPDTWHITENALRREHGEAARISYIGEYSHEDVLELVLAANNN